MALLNALRAQMRARSPATAAELPFRWLFAAAAEAVMIADTATGRVIEANPAAAWLLRRRRADLIGNPWQQAFRGAGGEPLAAELPDATSSDATHTLAAETVDGGAKLTASLSRIQQSPGSYLLIRLEAASQRAGRGDPSEVFDALDESPVGFLVTDAGLRIEYANRAFIAMIGLESPEEVRGRSIARWLELSEVDVAQLHEQMARREAVTEIATTLVAEHESPREVEVTAVAVPDDLHPCWGFSVRAAHPGALPTSRRDG